ncbi:MAG: hypothetical protein IT313_13430 [Anaerolineales bacterium]|nr:hypothetical protein [Anaerolineales bacterium]
MEWHFIKQPPVGTTRDPIAGEFFSTDAIENPAQALVREGIQNALDALDTLNGKSVHVRIYCGKLTKKERISYWLNGAWDHYKALKNGLGKLPESDNELSFLVFEDFGTTGLSGDVEQAFDMPDVKNPFYYFFRAEGRSGKGEQDRGRWGVGKYVFPRASRVSTLLALTIRSDDKKHLLMGRSILKSRWVQGGYYSPDGYFGIKNGDQRPILPVDDAKILGHFRSDFKMKRKDESGLSIVVPYLYDDITTDNLQKAVIEDYFYPILKGDLTVTVESDESTVEINATTLKSFSSTVNFENFNSLIQLAEWSLSKEPFYELKPCSDKRPTWSNDLIPEDILSNMRTQFENGEYLSVKASLSVRLKDDVEIPSYFMVYLKQGKNDDGRPLFIREGIIISDVKKKVRRTSGVLSLVIIEDKPLATLLGDSENPAHTQWQTDSSNFRNKYIYGKSYIDFVKNIVSDIVSALFAQEDELDENLLLDIFSLPAEEDETTKREDKQKDNKPGTETEKVTLDLESRERKFEVQQIAGGFQVKAGKAKLKPSTKLEVYVAYDVRKGNPLKKYDLSDFRLDQTPIKIKKPSKGLKLTRIHENLILADVINHDFELLVTGFDQNRDLYVKIVVNEGEK